MVLNSKGMSLIEVLVTIVIIGIVFVLLAQSMDFLTTSTLLHDDQKEATELVEQEFDKALDQLKDGENISERYVVDQYLVTVHTSKLIETSQSHSSLPHQVALSGVYDHESEPNLVTVTVAWGKQK